MSRTIPYKFSKKHLDYIRECEKNEINVAEGAVRAGKTIDNIFAFAHELKTTPDRIHLASGATVANAKLNIGDCNGFGLEHIFRNQCHWGKYKDNDALIINGKSTDYKTKIVIFAGGGKADSFRKIRGNSYGMWIATEANLHHDSFIQEAFNRQLASVRRKVFWDLNPDNPRALIYTKYIDAYAEKQEAGQMYGGYHYEHFTINDNVTISEERKEAIISQYDPTSIWYLRDILGQRVSAEGLIYKTFASEINLKHKTYELQDLSKLKDLQLINVGVDFGGNHSGHAFVATGITRGYREVIALRSQFIDCSTREEIDAERLGMLFVDFCKAVVHDYGYITMVYADSAEQTLIQSLRVALRKGGLGWLNVQNALKTHINDRIALTDKLMAQGRWFYLPMMCGSLVSALCTCVWNPKNLTRNERLDDGTSDIDTMDAYEYSVEKYISMLVKK